MVILDWFMETLGCECNFIANYNYLLYLVYELVYFKFEAQIPNIFSVEHVLVVLTSKCFFV
jgi:hypothetical protein